MSDEVGLSAGPTAEPIASDVPDMLYPVGCFVDGAGPNGELARYATPEEAVIVTPPLSDIMDVLRVPQPVETAQETLVALGVPEHVIGELVDERWVLVVPAAQALDPASLAGYRLIPNVSGMKGDGEYGLVLTSATSGQTATVLASTVAVLRYGLELDVPAAVVAAATETGLSADVVGAALMQSLGDLLASGTAYLSAVVA